MAKRDGCASVHRNSLPVGLVCKQRTSTHRVFRKQHVNAPGGEIRAVGSPMPVVNAKEGVARRYGALGDWRGIRAFDDKVRSQVIVDVWPTIGEGTRSVSTVCGSAAQPRITARGWLVP